MKRKNTRAPCRIRREGITCRGVVPFVFRRRRDVLFFSFFLKKTRRGSGRLVFLFFRNKARPLHSLPPTLRPLVGAGHARPAAYRQIPFTINPLGRDSSLPNTFPPPQTATAARGLAALQPHIKPVRRAGCPHPAETYRHIPFPHRRPVGAGHAQPAAYRQIPFTINPSGRDSSLPGTSRRPQTATAARGLAALRPHLKTHA